MDINETALVIFLFCFCMVAVLFHLFGEGETFGDDLYN
jgi:hypothetical protein